MAPSDGKHLDAILKLIQKPIDWLDDGKAAKTAPRENGEDGAEAKPSRGRRGRATRPAKTPGTEKQQDTPVEAAAEAVESTAPARGGGRQRNARRPVSTETEVSAQPEKTASEERPAAKSSARQRNARKSETSAEDTPFGDAGPIPAFLLRSARIS